MSDCVWIYTTWPEAQSASKAAGLLVGEKLAACANILPGVQSVFEWEGEIQRESECAMVLKTSAQAAPRLRARFVELHPYDEPCFLALKADNDLSAPDFLNWIRAQTKTAGGV